MVKKNIQRHRSGQIKKIQEINILTLNHYKFFVGLLILSHFWQSFADSKPKCISELTPQRIEQIMVSDNNPIERRNAFRQMLKGPKAETTAKKYLTDTDPLIRKASLYFLIKHLGIKSVDYMIVATTDQDSSVRMFALSGLTPYSAKPNVQVAIDRIEQKDPDPTLRRQAATLNWPFNRENRLLRDDPSWDYEITTLKSIKIPEKDWKFTTDPNACGHRQNFFDPTFNDSSWKSIKAGHWETQGWPNYDGIAWYRIRFQVSEKIDCNAVELLFEGVDESAWVWLNGIYLGKHDIGTIGWDVPFRLDATKEIKWGVENVLVVRVLDTTMGGGIWKPIIMEILK